MKGKITKRSVDALKAGSEEVRLTDTDIDGFGVRVGINGRKTYFLRYRTKDGKRRLYTIGRHGAPWTPDAARTEAIKMLVSVNQGADPTEERRLEQFAETVDDLCDEYLEAAKFGRLLKKNGEPKKASTLATDIGRIERHIKPQLGRRKVKDVSPRDVENFRDAVREGLTATDVKTGSRGRAIVTGGDGTATRTLGLLSGIFSFALRKGYIEANPVHGVPRFPSKSRQRALTETEYAIVGGAIEDAQAAGVNPVALTTIKALLLTGCRKSEVLTLTKAEVNNNASCLHLKETKTGSQIRPVGKSALKLLDGSLMLEGNPHLFPSRRGSGPYIGVPKVWDRMRDAINLHEVSLHTFRHSFASVAAELGYSELTIAGLLGHSLGTVTSRYTHLPDKSLVAAADHVSSTVAARLKLP